MALQLTIDCTDPDRLVPFWCLALDYEPVPPPDGHPTWRSYYLGVGVPESELGDGECLDRVQDPSGAGPLLWFQVVPEPKTVKNRVHLDVVIGRHLPKAQRKVVVEERVAQLLAAGGTRLRTLDSYDTHYGVTLQDPEGNELCVT
jgi:hypothetical protein